MVCCTLGSCACLSQNPGAFGCLFVEPSLLFVKLTPRKPFALSRFLSTSLQRVLQAWCYTDRIAMSQGGKDYAPSKVSLARQGRGFVLLAFLLPPTTPASFLLAFMRFLVKVGLHCLLPAWDSARLHSFTRMQPVSMYRSRCARVCAREFGNGRWDTRSCPAGRAGLRKRHPSPFLCPNPRHMFASNKTNGVRACLGLAHSVVAGVPSWPCSSAAHTL